MGAERRKYHRVEVSIALEDVMELNGLTMREPGKVTNLSAGGCGVTSEGMYQVGAVLSFSFTLPNGKPLMNVKGRVVRVDKDEKGWFHGILFEDLGFKNWMSLRWFLMFHKAA